MSSSHQVSTQIRQVLGAVLNHVEETDNHIHKIVVNRRELWAQVVSPRLSQEVRPGDVSHGGVAVHLTDHQIEITPFVFRLACTNGSILIENLTTCTIPINENEIPKEELDKLHEIMHDCMSPTTLESIIARMREATQDSIAPNRQSVVETLMRYRSTLEHNFRFNYLDQIIRFENFFLNELKRLHMFDRFAHHSFLDLLTTMSRPIDIIVDRFTHNGEHTRYGLANAITSLGRDTDNIRVRWYLESLGGCIATLAPPPHPPDHFAPARPYARRAKRAAKR